MEIVIPVSPSPGADFDFNSARSSPSRLSAPSSPRRFGEYFFNSAPTSPSRLSEFYSEFDNFCMVNDYNDIGRQTRVASSKIAFDWEEKPGTPKAKPVAKRNEDDFAFDISGEVEKTSSQLSAEELFDGGKIRPLKPPPRLQRVGNDDEISNVKSPLLSPRSPRSPRSPLSQGRKMIREAFSPRSKKETDPFTAAVENTRNGERGRERRSSNLPSSSSRRIARSLSPYRVSQYPWEEEEEENKQQQQQHKTANQPSALNPKPTTKSSSRKWRLKDFLLFRSASEGRATDKHRFSNYAALFHKKPEDTKNSSFRSTDGSGSSRRKGRVSAHELHYTKNKAAAEDLKKKTFLPYKQGILGRFAFNPALHSLSNGFHYKK